mmetsp:Transcript_563/g.2246  ORF Transcript_563/g.2246 Transcript_563/m.2246 type:complete len:310 (-) Transcript_563:137-1066(-)
MRNHTWSSACRADGRLAGSISSRSAIRLHARGEAPVPLSTSVMRCAARCSNSRQPGRDLQPGQSSSEGVPSRRKTCDSVPSSSSLAPIAPPGSPGNSGRRRNSSAMMQPAAHTSTLSSCVGACIISSGARYHTVANMWPIACSGRGSLHACPKSASRSSAAPGDTDNSTFSGFKSRCIQPRSCISQSPPSRACASALTFASDSTRPESQIRSLKSPTHRSSPSHTCPDGPGTASTSCTTPRQPLSSARAASSFTLPSSAPLLGSTSGCFRATRIGRPAFAPFREYSLTHPNWPWPRTRIWSRRLSARCP